MPAPDQRGGNILIRQSLATGQIGKAAGGNASSRWTHWRKAIFIAKPANRPNPVSGAARFNGIEYHLGNIGAAKGLNFANTGRGGDINLCQVVAYNVQPYEQ